MTTYTPLRTLMREGTVQEQRNLLLSEATTHLHHNFNNWIIPGMLQTEDYARQRLREFTDMIGCPDTVEETVRGRMQRRTLLGDDEHRFHFLLHQNTLYAAMAAPEVMRAQMAQLITDIERFPARIGIIPSTTQCYAPMCEFWSRDWKVVEVETHTGLVRVEDPDEIKLYMKLWGHYAYRAQRGDQACAMAQAALDYWAGE